MSNASEVLESAASYHLVKQLFDQLSWQEKEKLKREIDITTQAKKPPKVFKIAHSRLTEREQQVLALIADGYTRKEVGDALKISHNTASCHVSHIYEKLQISTIAEATRAAIQLGVSTEPTELPASKTTQP